MNLWSMGSVAGKLQIILAGKYVEKAILDEYKNHFTKTKKRGPKPKGKVSYFNKFKCLLCNRNYATSIGAMVDHAKAHIRGDVIKYGVVKGSGAASGDFRPEHHAFDATSGRFFYGSDAEYKSYELPAPASIAR